MEELKIEIQQKSVEIMKGFPVDPGEMGLNTKDVLQVTSMDKSEGMWLCYSVLLTVQNMDQNQNGIQMWWYTAAIPELKETLAR